MPPCMRTNSANLPLVTHPKAEGVHICRFGADGKLPFLTSFSCRSRQSRPRNR